ncbi:hypothetical protein DFH11DRAFT_1742472 [Phellopilus nigrolimitatus]|nr:hypothetical protein DFH11DRAFT_1742472 [Phellopilus nigrolimitatus]
MMNNPGGLLAPPPPAATTNKTMSNTSSSDSISESGQSSPDSSCSDSPFVGFERSIDTSDPLNFLMDSVTADMLSSGDSSAEESLLTSSTPPSLHESPTRDWTATKDPAALWAQTDLSSMSFDSFNSAMNLLDFDPTSLGVPLQYDPMLFSDEAFALSIDPLSSSSGTNAPTDLSSYAFSFGTDSYADLHAQSSDGSSRRLSVTSSPSSSKASLSPAMDHTQPASVSLPNQPAAQPTAEPQMSENQAVDELVQRARQIVGVAMIAPVGADQTQSNKLPIPRLQRPALSSSSASSPTTSQNACSPTSMPAAPPARTKTSHTTIERRYRTNLNARIQSLRAAVPALRVLEQKAGNRVGNLSLKAGTRRASADANAGVTGEEEDVIDDRGFVDGVKVARKGSKANVLGKAVEYIRVLKRRELRLKREQEGLKALISGLVGGPQLVQEWEAMWRERFGGPEKDEVDGEDGEADDENEDGEDDEDGEEGEDGGDELGTSAGKKRKRAKVDTLAPKAKGKKTVTAARPQPQQPVPIMPAQSPSTAPDPAGIISMSIPVQPEKRKRGRPRKVPLPPVILPSNLVPDTFTAQQYQQQQQQPIRMAPMGEVKMEVDAAVMSQSPSIAPTQRSETQSPIQPQNPQPAQYLLAAFAFFSFANSPVSFYRSSWDGGHNGPAHEHSHSGSVLGPRPEPSARWHGSPSPMLTSSWRDAVQVIHVVVSFLLLVSVVTPWLPRVMRSRIVRAVPRTFRPILGGSFVSHVSTSSGVMARSGSSSRPSSDDECASDEEKADASGRMVLLAALHRGPALTPVLEVELLREALGLGTGVFGLVMSLARQVGAPRKSHSRFGLERRMLEQRAFLRLAELVALDVHASVLTRIQTYLYAFKFFSVFSASAADISTLALIIQSLWRAKSTSLWALALSRAQGKGSLSPHISRTFETFVLENLTVDEAAQKIAKLDLKTFVPHHTPSSLSDSFSESSEGDYRASTSPLAVLASQLIRDNIREQAELVFLQTVSGEMDREPAASDPDSADREMRRIVAAGRSLDMHTADLVDLFEQVCNPTPYFAPVAASETALDDETTGEDEDGELRALLHAVVLYRRIFPSTLLNIAAEGDGCRSSGIAISSISISLTMPSPPPSPSRKNAALHLSLRRCLDSAAFDSGDALEDARDRVVDMLTSEAAGWPKRLQY